MPTLVVILILLAGCTEAIDATVDPEDLTDVAEAYCKANPHLPCGHVWLCETPAENELGQVEICVLNAMPIEVAEAVYGACQPTPRHVGLCWYCCGEGCTAGCNALTSCFCPEAK